MLELTVELTAANDTDLSQMALRSSGLYDAPGGELGSSLFRRLHNFNDGQVNFVAPSYREVAPQANYGDAFMNAVHSASR